MSLYKDLSSLYIRIPPSRGGRKVAAFPRRDCIFPHVGVDCRFRIRFNFCVRLLLLPPFVVRWLLLLYVCFTFFCVRWFWLLLYVCGLLPGVVALRLLFVNWLLLQGVVVRRLLFVP